MGVSARFDLRDTSVMQPAIVEVRLVRLAENFRAIRAAVAVATIMPIVKANAYGYGLVDVARHLVALGTTSLGVALLEEAIVLRNAGVTVSGNEQMVTPSGLFPAGSPTAAPLGASKNSHYVSFALS
jgi:alanine racemase